MKRFLLILLVFLMVACEPEELDDCEDGTDSEKVECIAKNTSEVSYDDDDIERSEINGTRIWVVYRLGTAVFSGSEHIDNAKKNAVRLACNYFSKGFNEHSFLFEAQAELTDQFGNNDYETVVEILLESSVVSQVNCDKPQDVNVEAIAASYDVHPALSQ